MFRKWNEWAPLPVRLVMALCYAAAGGLKVFTPDGRYNFVFELSHWGIPQHIGNFLAWTVGLLEFATGLLLLIGAFVSLMTILQTVGTLGLIIAIVIGGQPPAYDGLGYFPYVLPNISFSWVIIAGLLTLLFGGAGKFSVDSLRKAS